MNQKTDTLILIKAMRRLADDIQSDDGVANAAIAEAAERLAELERENAALRDALNNAIVLLRRWNKNDVTDDVVIDTRKTIHAARKEAQP